MHRKAKQMLLVTIRRLNRVLLAVGNAVSAGAAAAAASAAAAEAAAASVVGKTGRNGEFVLFFEMKDAVEAPPDSEEHSRPRTDDGGFRSTTPSLHLSNFPASRGSTAESASGAAAEARGGGDCWRALATVAPVIESVLGEKLGCRWVALLPVSASPFDA